MHWDGSYFLHADLDASWDRRDKLPITPYVRMLFVATDAIRHFLGPDWIERNIFADRFGFLSARFRTVRVHSLEWDIAAMRIIELAEMLLNFQDAPGFASVLREFEAPEKVAPTFGALEMAGFLASSGNEVTFRDPELRRHGKSHDFDVKTEAGLPVCVEAKCILKSNETARSTIRNRLRKSFDQLPAGCDGAICVRVPEQWLSNDLIEQQFEPVAKQMLRNTTRVASIIMVTTNRVTHEDESANVMLATELCNLRSNPDGSRIKLLKMNFRNINWFYLGRYFGLSTDMTPEQAESLTQIYTQAMKDTASNERSKSP